jgi:hypothetical protein
MEIVGRIIYERIYKLARQFNDSCKSWYGRKQRYSNRTNQHHDAFASKHTTFSNDFDTGKQYHEQSGFGVGNDVYT